MAGLEAVVNAALALQVDCLVVAGDFFDNIRLSDSTVEKALEQLKRLDLPIVIAPGNHDCLDDNSIYRRVDLSRAGDHVRLIQQPAGEHVLLHDLSLAVWARAMVDHHPGNRPLEGYTPGPSGYWNVVLAHGHFFATADDLRRSSLIRREDIAQLECSYLALGHWHRFLDVSANGVPAFYSGSPSEAGGSFPSANLVTLDPASGMSLQRVRLDDGFSPR